jgi:gliding motility-associated-like protein
VAVDFIVTDLRCGFNSLSEFTTVYFIISPTQNNIPYVSTTLPGDTLSIILNSAENLTFSFDVFARDIDTAQISLFGIGRGFDLGAAKMDFLNKIGTREINSPFNWTPDCSILEGKSEKLFTLDFITEDKSCDAARDTATVFLLIKDISSDVALSIPNVVTPNQDGKNDCFSLSTLPPDNCFDQFEELLIYNRWGTMVYRTTDKNANWCPSDSPQGNYFYQIKFLKRFFKGVITLIK